MATTLVSIVTTNSTGIPDTGGQASVAMGTIAVLLAAIFFGINFLPVKKIDGGDGIFFQWSMCAGIWTIGLVTMAIRNFPPFMPLAMIGGFLWCTGNIMVVHIINKIGMAKGVLIWGAFNLIFGWASSRFGWFNVIPQVPNIIWMNYLGVFVCLVSAFLYMLMDTSGTNFKEKNQVVQETQDKKSSEVKENEFEYNLEFVNEIGFIQKVKNFFENRPLLNKTLATLMAALAGFLFGLSFTPVLYMKDRWPGSSKNGLDYVFSQFTGTFISSTFYFMVYCAFTKNKPFINPQIALPSYISGAMWGVANTAWFVANDALSESISFPIVTTLPGIVASVVGGVFFKEIQGKRNIIVLIVAILVGLTGSILTGLSKK